MVQGYVRYKGRDFYLIRKPIQLGISSHASITTLSNTDYIGRASIHHSSAPIAPRNNFLHKVRLVI